MVENIDFDGRWKGPKDIGSATIGTGWADVGSAFKTGGVHTLGAFLNLTINLSTDVRVRVKGLFEAGGDEHILPVQSLSTDIIAVDLGYYELNSDADQDVLLAWQLDGMIPLSLLQICAGTAGGTAAVLTGANIVTAI